MQYYQIGRVSFPVLLYIINIHICYKLCKALYSLTCSM